MDWAATLQPLLSHKHRAQREAGLEKLRQLLSNVSAKSAEVKPSDILQFLAQLASAQDRWEARHGGVTGLSVFVPWLNGQNQLSDDVAEAILTQAIGLLEDPEFRVRLAAGELLAILCQTVGVHLFSQRLEPLLLKHIEENMFLDRDAVADETPEGTRLKEKLLKGQELTANRDERNLQQSPRNGYGSDDESKSVVSSKMSSQSSIYHDTAGWRYLHTYVKCLQAILERCGAQLAPCIHEPLVETVLNCAVHCNRFIRINCFGMCAAMAEHLPTTTLLRYAKELASRLAIGLADDWGEVRMVASTATQTFMNHLDLSARKEFSAMLLPRICLNRHYVAEGVRTHSQQLWRELVADQGPATVAVHMDAFVKYYISQTQSSNHELRDAACVCIAEVLAILPPEALLPHSEVFQNAMLSCLHDPHWIVRSSACAAQAKLFCAFPDFCRGRIEQFLPLLFENLVEKVPSVREDAAVALAVFAKTYPDHLSRVLEELSRGLSAVSRQASDAQRFSKKGVDGMQVDEEEGQVDPEMAKIIRDNDEKLHTDRPMWCCCSVSSSPATAAPQPHAHHDHSHSDGHHHHHHEGEGSDPAYQPWMQTSGGVFLMRELAPLCPNEIETRLPQLAEACNRRHYLEHVYLLETVWQSLKPIAEALGKRVFKRRVDGFLDSLFYSLRCHSKLASVAAQDFLRFLSIWLGPQMFRSRVEQHNVTFLMDLDRFVGPG